MNEVAFYIHDATGRIRESGFMAQEFAQAQCRPGDTFVLGTADPRTQCVVDGVLVPIVPTTAQRSAEARTERDRLLDACDWVTSRAYSTGTPVPAAWAAYMQALRDVPEQAGFPESITWPTPP